MVFSQTEYCQLKRSVWASCICHTWPICLLKSSQNPKEFENTLEFLILFASFKSHFSKTLASLVLKSYSYFKRAAQQDSSFA